MEHTLKHRTNPFIMGLVGSVRNKGLRDYVWEIQEIAFMVFL